jgi:hypothetical protein
VKSIIVVTGPHVRLDSRWVEVVADVYVTTTKDLAATVTHILTGVAATFNSRAKRAESGPALDRTTASKVARALGVPAKALPAPSVLSQAGFPATLATASSSDTKYSSATNSGPRWQETWGKAQERSAARSRPKPPNRSRRAILAAALLVAALGFAGATAVAEFSSQREGAATRSATRSELSRLSEPVMKLCAATKPTKVETGGWGETAGTSAPASVGTYACPGKALRTGEQLSAALRTAGYTVETTDQDSSVPAVGGRRAGMTGMLARKGNSVVVAVVHGNVPLDSP